MNTHVTQASLRGRNWFNALTQNLNLIETPIDSLLIADGQWNGQEVRVFAIVTDELNKYPRARSGEVGLLEGWALAQSINELIQADSGKTKKRAILCIVDVPSQAYGRREEVLGIHQALAGAVDAYATARLAGHPIVSLLVGKSMSGAFLAHGYQANRILALKDQGVMVHAMGKESAARVTLRSVEELEALAATIPPMAYDIESYSTLGLLSDVLEVEAAEQPTVADIIAVKAAVNEAIQDIQKQGNVDLKHRLNGKNRKASKQVRELLREQWS
ncbi:biotin-independent malonate decarboxylase subunit gamma [Acinetobacter sp. C32I]|uniref:biotin-independent malonate decarboxylase subunit gamma n=1 Tax=Acinetobacter sp. C32I TaxID=2950074 RepID=UPI0020374C4E|nr:biotin-independent malonate decarboxylase subunit gamma [Acinetobacter sp. C32I]USA54439.1 biotin-independent malonate decarboxylase subunit gamma [Acinetobacter sp. C32I]